MNVTTLNSVYLYSHVTDKFWKQVYFSYQVDENRWMLIGSLNINNFYIIIDDIVRYSHSTLYFTSRCGYEVIVSKFIPLMYKWIGVKELCPTKLEYVAILYHILADDLVHICIGNVCWSIVTVHKLCLSTLPTFLSDEILSGH